jgi:DNA polymerase-3 subunit delta'
VGDAERLVPQEASPEAANALLKLLEEPPEDTVFVLTAEDPKALLPTVRSRAVPLRLGRLGSDEVRGFLESHLDPPLDPAILDERVALAEGSIGRALWEVEDAAQARARALEFLDAALGGAGPGADRVQLMERVLKQAPWSARGEFSGMLEALGEALSDASRARAVPGSLERRDPAALSRALILVAEAEEAARGNVNPQLLLAVLGEQLGATL